MSIAQTIQDAWNRQAKWLVLLRPLSWLYGGAFAFNKKLYTLGLKEVYQEDNGASQMPKHLCYVAPRGPW